MPSAFGPPVEEPTTTAGVRPGDRALLGAGDRELAARVGRYLEEDWAPTLNSTYDARTGERGTSVQLVERGSWEWLRACLGQAAEELGLVMVVEVP